MSAVTVADIEAAGVNVEDVTIDHDLERQVGWLAVQVEPASATRLARALTDAGWFVRP